MFFGLIPFVDLTQLLRPGPPKNGPKKIKPSPQGQLKICLLSYRSNPYSGGQGVYVNYLSRELVELGHTVDVISGRPYPNLHDSVNLIKLPGLNLYEREERWQDMIDAAVFFRDLLTAGVPHIAVENPVMHGWAKKIVGRGHDQTIQPYEFGHDASKRTCLWLKNLPELKPTEFVEPGPDGTYGNQTPSGQNKLGPSEDRGEKRSRTYQGIAEAMAEQWSPVIAMS